MTGRVTIMGVALLTACAAVVPGAASAATHRHHARHARHVVRSETRYVAAPAPSQDALTLLPNQDYIGPDLSTGDGFGGGQTPGLGAYGLAGGGLWGTPALQ